MPFVKERRVTLTPLLDGRYIKPEDLNPVLHTFIGTFRPPTPPDAQGADVILCPGCGHSLWTMEAGAEHWRQGHFDVPQYQTLSRFFGQAERGELTPKTESGATV